MLIIEAPIVAVTVFVNRARVTRRGTVTLEAGEHVLVLETLPETLESDSVRASGRGSGITLLGVDVKTEYLTSSPQQNVADLETQIEAAQEILQTWVDEATSLDLQMTLLDSFSKHSSRKLGQSLVSSLKTVTELNAYVAEQMNTLQTAQRINAQQQREIKKQLEALNAQLFRSRTITQYEKRLIHVTVRADATTEFALEVAYSAVGASWQPIYDVRLRDDNEVELTYLANVTQRTGEDWGNVEMALSTARPAISTHLPELNPWYIWTHDPRQDDREHMAMNRRKAEPLRRAMDARQQRTEDMTVYDEIPQAAFAQTTIAASPSGASVTYMVGTPVTVPADGSPHKTTVAIVRLRAKLDYVTAPKIAEEAYLRAKITNTTAYTLLPGDASIFHGDEFVGKTRLALIAPNEEFEVQLGLDDRIKLERELIHREVSKRFIGLSRRVSYVYRITVTNLLPTSTSITVLDQYPIPREENVKVQKDSIEPEPTETTDLGVLTWTFELASNAKQVITLGFTVEHGRDLLLQGLPE